MAVALLPPFTSLMAARIKRNFLLQDVIEHSMYAVTDNPFLGTCSALCVVSVTSEQWLQGVVTLQ